MSNSKFIGTLGEYSWQKTDDGSQTLFSGHFDEACHSQGGAYEETVFNYVHGCNITELKDSPIKIFEVGFGTGLGLECTIDELRKVNSPLLLDFYSCELDPVLVSHSLERMNLKSVKVYKNGIEIIKVTGKDFKATIFLGDIRENLPKLIKFKMIPNVDAIYQDAFSPKRNSRLWTYEWFKDLIEITHKETILSTYTCTKAVWKAMVASGWGVRTVPGFNLKRWSTRATPHGNTTKEVLELLEKTPMQMLKD